MVWTTHPPNRITLLELTLETVPVVVPGPDTPGEGPEISARA
jgi:hypothetical protein